MPGIWNENGESQLYLFDDTDLNDGEALSQNLEEVQPYGKYAPFNFILISNQSNKTMNLYLDSILKAVIPAGTIQSFTPPSIQAFRNFSLINESGANSTGSVNVSVQKVLLDNDLLREIVRKLK